MALQGELISSHKHFRVSEISKIKIKQTKWERNKKLKEIFFLLRKKKEVKTNFRNRDKLINCLREHI